MEGMIWSLFPDNEVREDSDNNKGLADKEMRSSERLVLLYPA